MRGPRRELAIIHDGTVKGLSQIWSAADLFDGTPHHYGATSWDAAIDWVADIGRSDSIEEVQYLGHGTRRGAMFNGRTIKVADLITLRLACPSLRRIWFRVCDMAWDPALIASLVKALDVDVVAHREVISAGRRRFADWIPLVGGMRLPAPHRQGSIKGYTTEELAANVPPGWGKRDGYTKGVSALRFTVPDWVLQPERAGLRPPPIQRVA